jgi:uncharacterized protein (DUF1697 family)
MRYAAFIRAIMIGREGLTRVVVLDAFQSAGAVDPTNHLATGNVAFDADPRSVDLLVAQVSARLSEVKGRSTPIFVRSLDELASTRWDDIFASRPAGYDKDLLVTFVPGHAPPLDLPLAGPKDLSVVFDHRPGALFSASRSVDGQTSNPGGMIEKALGVPVTTRAVGTITKVLQANGRPT